MSGVTSVNRAAAESLGLDAATTEVLATGIGLIHILQVYTSSMVRCWSFASVYDSCSVIHTTRSHSAYLSPGRNRSMGLASVFESRARLHLEEGVDIDQVSVPLDTVLRARVLFD